MGHQSERVLLARVAMPVNRSTDRFKSTRPSSVPFAKARFFATPGRTQVRRDDRILQSYPYSGSRERIAVRTSFDEAQTWTMPKVIYEGSSAYADLVQTQDDRVGLLYERDGYTKITYAGFTTEWLDEGVVEPPVDISDGTFYGFWALDQQSGQTADDSSGEWPRRTIW